MRKTVLLYTLLFFLAAVPSFASSSICDAIAGNLVQNCGFETGGFTDWTHTGTWDYTDVTSNPSYVNSGTYAAQIGPYVDEGLSSISQVLSTSPGTYDLTFYLMHGGDCTGQTDCSEALVTWDGTTLMDELNAGIYGYTEISFLVTATGPSTLEFGFASNPNYYYLDDVSVVPTTTTIPEPGTLSLALVGSLPGIMFGLRRSLSRWM